MSSHTPPTISAITLGVRDVARSLTFYTEGLGFTLVQPASAEIAFVRAGYGLMLALWDVQQMPSEYGEVGHGPLAPPVSLGHNVRNDDEVERHYRRALEAGASSITAPTRQPWGGMSACVADPDGFRWDFVHNPSFVIDADGHVSSV
ncbi:VOC family protein [Glutamicibacter sp. PS]|uniref:VOC family protein n=1 Tax=Glutamicibacter sp. PS TaxID=3075634 RepID=UPI00284114F9|nr:VOC family protein [Glutamicibacter sp. PS]MDR4532703.1 VOC family protein [Glutamicibacter sp. PS]